MPKRKFNIGDTIRATPETDSLAQWKGADWLATVVSAYRTDTGADSDGVCYVTEGRWSDEPGAGNTSRQLYSKHMVKA